MELYNSFKPALLFIIFLIGAGKAVFHFGKNEIKGMWITIFVAMGIYFFVNGPQKTMQAGDGLMNAILNFISTFGQGGNA